MAVTQTPPLKAPPGDGNDSPATLLGRMKGAWRAIAETPVGRVAGTMTRSIRHNGIYLALAAIILLFYFLTDGILLTPQNVTNVLVQNSYILILAIGMVIVIIAGHIDLSVGSVAAFVGAISGVMMVDWGWPVWLAVIASLLVGAVVGAWQGFWVAFVGIPAFITTLAGMLIFRGLTMVVLANKQISPFPESFRDIASGYLPSMLGTFYDPLTGRYADLFTVLIAVVAVVGMFVMAFRTRKARVSYNEVVDPMWFFLLKNVLIAVFIVAFATLLAEYKGLPIVLIILAALILIYSVLTKRSVMGRHVYAIGGNLNAARLSGIKTKWTTFIVFVNMSTLAALAGLVFTARLNMAGPKAGVNFELDAIAASFIGGAAVQGGIGTVVGAIVGGLIMGVMNNGMSIMGVGIDWQQAVKGLVLLLAVAFDIWNKKRSGSASS